MNNSDFGRIVAALTGLIAAHPTRAGLGAGAVRRSGSETIERARGERVLAGAPPGHVCFVNANNFNLALSQPELMAILKKADLVLPDGIGVKLALRLAGERLWHNLNGTDLFPLLARELERRGGSIFLLGGSPEVVAAAAGRVGAAYPGLRIVGTQHGFFAPGDEPAIRHRINAAGPDILIVGMGTPRQEFWVERQREHLSVPLVMSMGGLIDFLGGRNSRAPAWMRRMGLEWVYRMALEPRRLWRRYVIGNPLFLWRAWRWISAHPDQVRVRVAPLRDPAG